MKSLKYASIITVTLLLSACSNQPDFDPNLTEVQTVDGKSYNIPLGAKPSPYVDAKVIKFYQELGLSNCQTGDITWEEESAIHEMNEAIGKGDKSVYHKLAKEGRIGCSSPVGAK